MGRSVDFACGKKLVSARGKEISIRNDVIENELVAIWGDEVWVEKTRITFTEPRVRLILEAAIANWVASNKSPFS